MNLRINTGILRGTRTVEENGARSEILVGREAIFDRRKRVVAFELLYQDWRFKPGRRSPPREACFF